MNQLDLQNRTAVITGGARGIGLAIAQRLAASGARCSLWDRDPKALESVPHAGEKFHTAEVDVASPQSVHDAAQSTLSVLGRVDILINNAGIAGVSKPLWECTPEEWRTVMDIDLFGVYLCCHAIVPSMIANGWGRIVNIASIAGKEGNPNASHYSAAKAGVIGLTKSLGKELAKTEIRVNCITPAVIETDILKQVSEEHIRYMLSKIPLNRPGRTEEVAALVAWLCTSECSFTTGAVFDISGGRATY